MSCFGQKKGRMRNLDLYQEISQRTAKSDVDVTNPRLLHGAIGICGEAGELIDAVKTHMIYGSKLDIDNIKEELGDIIWYMAMVLSSINSSFDEITDMNLSKLEKRYPEKMFSTERSENRDREAELNAMRSLSGISQPREIGEMIENYKDKNQKANFSDSMTLDELRREIRNRSGETLRHRDKDIKELI